MLIYEEVSLNELTVGEFLKVRKPLFSHLEDLSVSVDIDGLPYYV